MLDSIKNTFHHHQWIDTRQKALGELPKRNLPSVVYMKGTLERCECGHTRIRCGELPPVECE